jgi:hypothetical protein
MKPTIQSNTRRASRLPKTEYSYHASSFASMGGRCFGSRRPSIRSISQAYFKSEARSSFVVEAVLFSVIVITAAAAVISSASGMVHLVRAIASV